jgi:hypothetical protein
LTHIEFVEFCLDTLSPNSVASIRKKNLGDGVHNADFIWTEIYRESGSVQLCSLAVRLVKDIITFVTEASRLTVMKKPAKSDRMILVADVYREVELSNACKSIRRVRHTTGMLPPQAKVEDLLCMNEPNSAAMDSWRMSEVSDAYVWDIFASAGGVECEVRWTQWQ